MSKSNKNKPIRQHYVPKCYLAGFAEPKSKDSEDPCIWIFDKNGKNPRLDKTGNILIKKHIYTIEIEGKKDYSIETSLANLEGQYAKILNSKIKNTKPLSEKEQAVFCIFIAALLQRTLKNKDRIEQFIDEIITRGEFLAAHHGHKSSKTLNDFKKLKANAHKLSLVETLPEISQIIFEMNLAFLIVKNESTNLITSDDPCKLFNPKLQWQKFYGPGLEQKHIELTIPLSTDIAACFSWSNLRGYLEINKSQAEELNRMTRAHSYRYFVSSQRKIKRRWFLSFPLSLRFIFKIIRHKFGNFIYKRKIKKQEKLFKKHVDKR